MSEKTYSKDSLITTCSNTLLKLALDHCAEIMVLTTAYKDLSLKEKKIRNKYFKQILKAEKDYSKKAAKLIDALREDLRKVGNDE